MSDLSCFDIYKYCEKHRENIIFPLCAVRRQCCHGHVWGRHHCYITHICSYRTRVYKDLLFTTIALHTWRLVQLAFTVVSMRLHTFSSPFKRSHHHPGVVVLPSAFSSFSPARSNRGVSGAWNHNRLLSPLLLGFIKNKESFYFSKLKKITRHKFSNIPCTMSFFSLS